MLKHIKDGANPYEKFNTTRYFTEIKSSQMQVVPAYWFANEEEK
jgi:hypothetical protein